jgi:hypothetical protein
VLSGALTARIAKRAARYGRLEKRGRVAISEGNPATSHNSEVRGFACPPHGGVAFSQRSRDRAYTPLCAQARDKTQPFTRTEAKMARSV